MTILKKAGEFLLPVAFGVLIIAGMRIAEYVSPRPELKVLICVDHPEDTTHSCEPWREVSEMSSINPGDEQ